MTTTTQAPAKCKRCHRTLRDPKSVARGYGRTCAAKVQAKVDATVAPFKRPQIDKALALIANGGIVTTGTSFYQVVGTGGVYRTDATLCTCTAGQHGRTCYHLIAARVLDSVAAA